MYLRLSRIKKSVGFTDSTNWKYSGRENAAAAYAAATLTLGGHGGFGRGAQDGGADDAATTAWPEGVDPHPYAPTAPASASKGGEDEEEDEEDTEAKDSVTKKRKFEEEMNDESEVSDTIAATGEAAADDQKTGQVQQEQDNENDNEKEVEQGGETSPPQQEKEKKMRKPRKTNAEKEAEWEAKERKREQQKAAKEMRAANKKLRRHVAATSPWRIIRYPPSPE